MWSGPETVEALAAKVKELQKTNPVAKDQWGAFADQNGGGTRDPSKHQADFLQGFLDHVSSGKMLPTGPMSGAAGGHGPAHGGLSPRLAEAIKSLQKRHEGFKDAWAMFCVQQGGGKYDPEKHETEFLYKFLEFMAGGGSSYGPSNNYGPVNLAGPPQKRMRSSSGMGVGMPSGGPSAGSDPWKDQLVTQIKQYQRLGDMQKELWSTYADQFLGGWRDPGRHEAAKLQEFCVNHDVPAASADGGKGGMGGMSGPSMQSWSGPGVSGSMGGLNSQLTGDPFKDGLVSRIKNFQKMSRENADTWITFCGLTKDPKLHDVAKLQEFCRLFAVL